MKETTQTTKFWTKTTRKGWFYESSRTVFNHEKPVIRPRINVSVDNRQLHLHARPTQGRPPAATHRPLLGHGFIDVQPA